jgi:hypothetical protein
MMKMLRPFICGAVVILGVTGSARAQAVVVDMAEVTCEHLLSASPNAIDAAIWLSGYYNGLQKNTKLDLKEFKNNAEIIVAECRADPKKTVMQTVTKLLSGK